MSIFLKLGIIFSVLSSKDSFVLVVERAMTFIPADFPA